MPQELDPRLPLEVRRSIEILDLRSVNRRLIQIGEYGDKYAIKSTVEIDCASRLELCKGVCCKLEFPLSKQDFEEGIVAWDPKRPYIGAKGADRRCVHQVRESCGCEVYENRPAPCRTYDCRNDRRVWLDFEGRVINPIVEEASWPIYGEEGGEWPG